MSYKDGMAAINLEMPARVPRTEYSLEMHWDALAAITKIPVTIDSPDSDKERACRELWRLWNFDFFWCTNIGNEDFGKWQTDMGHAVYAAGGVDRREVGACPFKTPEDALAFDPRDVFPKKNRRDVARWFEAQYRTQRDAHPDGVNMVGIYTTCISGLIAIFGWDMLLLAAGVDQHAFGELTNRYCQWRQNDFDALADADVPVVMIHDDMVWTAGPFISPAWYRKYVFPNMEKYFRPLIDSGKKVLFTSDGNYTEFLDDLARIGVHGFVMEPTTDMAMFAEKYGKSKVFVGNADTRILLSGTKKEIRAEVERCMSIGKKYPGFFMCVGNHIPPNTPVESVLYYNEVYEELSRR